MVVWSGLTSCSLFSWEMRSLSCHFIWAELFIADNPTVTQLAKHHHSYFLN